VRAAGRVVAVVLALALALAAACAPAGPGAGPDAPSAEAPQVRQAVVVRHIDGDTLRVRLATGAEERVRLIGIDCPEIGDAPERFGEEAAMYTAEAVPLGTTVWLETDAEARDRHGRLLAYVWLARPEHGDEAEVSASMLNARIVLDGFAYASTYPPNVRYLGVFTRCQAEANAEGRGLWAVQEPERQ
jgi:micrococcal nuclease